MASNNYTQESKNTSLFGQSSFAPLVGTQSGVQPPITYPTQFPMINFARTCSVSATNWNACADFELSPTAFIGMDSSIFTNNEEKSPMLQNASKKINKASPSTQAPVAAKASQKRSKRGRNPWTPKEDVKLMDLMKKYGQSWAMISSLMDGRTGKQVRDRYLNKLRPNIKLGDWTLQEDELLVSLCKEIGNRWSLIANHLPGRTEGQVKNRFYSHIKKRLQPDGTYNPGSASRTSSEGETSFPTSPEQEDIEYNFEQGFNANMLNSANSIPNFVQAKGAYVVEEEDYSEESTTQGPISQKDSNSPLRNDLVDITDVISYDAPEGLIYGQPQRADSFFFPSVINDSQVDEIISNVTDYFVANSNNGNNSSDIDSFFAEELRGEVKISSAYGCQQAESNERLVQLNRRKAYLELALAKTMKEMKGF